MSVSVNNHLGRILRRHAESERYAIRGADILAPPQFLAALLDSLSTKDLEQVGSRLGVSFSKDLIGRWGLTRNGVSFLRHLEIVSDHWRWFTLEKSLRSEVTILSVRTDLGPKWTYFVKGYVESSSREMGASVRTDVGDTTISIFIQDKYHDKYPESQFSNV